MMKKEGCYGIKSHYTEISYLSKLRRISKLKRFVKVIVIVLCLALALSIVAFGKDITIALVPKSLDNPIFLDAKESAEKTGIELGIKIEWVGPMKSDAAEQVGVIEGLIQKKVDGILISCNDPDALKPVIDKAIDKGIKVATFDSDSPNSKRLFYVGTDNYKAGKINAEYIMKFMNSKGKVAILTGVPGVSNLEERIRGFKETIKGSQIEVISIQPCDDDINKSVTVIEQYTRAHPELNGWFFDGGWPFFAPPEALGVLKEFRQKGGTVVSMDTFYPMLKYIQEDMVNVLVGQDYKAMGELGVKTLLKAIKGENIDQEVIDTGLEIVDKSNVEEVLKTKAPW